FDIDPMRTAGLAELGGTPADSPKQVAENARRIFLSLMTTEIACRVIEGENGILESSQRPTHILDTTTGDPTQVILLADRLSSRGIAYLDATVSGSSAQLRRREATFMVGGDVTSYGECVDLLTALSDNVFRVGEAGSGAKAKLASNLVIGLNRAALAEGLVFAEQLGLDLASFLELLKATPAYSAVMDSKGDKMLSGDFTPESRVAQHRKDIALIESLLHERGASLSLTTAYAAILDDLISSGGADQDNAAIITQIRRSARN
ncbi:MAG: NAD(P)-dependent oxidoreductase, partial [Candidatus Poribacteria bacterium]|nr:NAD(P)-dependent oxidoreductase [Candidatus Poribacteria bacterium]